MIRAIATLTTTLAALGGCGATDGPADVASSTVPPTTTRPAQVVVIPEDYAYPFDAAHGDRLDLVMNPDGGQLARCDDAGGELIYNPWSLVWMCEGVDF